MVKIVSPVVSLRNCLTFPLLPVSLVLVLLVRINRSAESLRTAMRPAEAVVTAAGGVVAVAGAEAEDSEEETTLGEGAGVGGEAGGVVGVEEEAVGAGAGKEEGEEEEGIIETHYGLNFEALCSESVALT